MPRTPSADLHALKMSSLILLPSPAPVSEDLTLSTEFVEDALPSQSTTDTNKSVTVSRDIVSKEESAFPPQLPPDPLLSFPTLQESAKMSTPLSSMVNASASQATT